MKQTQGSKPKGALDAQSKNDVRFWALNGKTAIRKPIPEEPSLLLASSSIIRFLVTITQNFSPLQTEPRATVIED